MKPGIYLQKPEGFVPSIEVAWAYMIYDNEILLLQRHDHKSQGGKRWAPAGKLDTGEESKDAVIREIMEETGIKLNTIDWVVRKAKTTLYSIMSDNFALTYDGYHVVLPEKPEVIISEYEHKDFKRVKIHEALSMNLIDNEVNTIQVVLGMKNIDEK